MSAFFVPVLFSFVTGNMTQAASLYKDTSYKTGKIGGGVHSIRNCTNNELSSPQTATVKWVYDGDTLLLTNKQKIRIIGIDTPETQHHKQRAEAYGAKAREALRELLKVHNYKVSLRYGKERYDRYKRTLAHVFLADGTNVSSWLLERGFAKTLAYPPNILLADCYKKLERYAQTKSLRIWKYKKNRLKDAKTLPLRIKGYVRLEGKVKRIFKTKKSTIIELESNFKRHIQLKIKKKNLGYFTSYNIDTLYNKVITVSGILKNKRNKRTIYLSHSSQIEIGQRRKVIRKTAAPIIKWSFE